MPNAPLKPCANRLCPELVPRGTAYCGKHKTVRYREQERGRPAGRKKRLGRLWQKKRAVVLAGEPLCRECRRAKATEVDHIIPWEQFRDKRYADAATNLQPLCKSCHSRKTASEVLNQ